MLQAPSYKILSQELNSADENENEFSSSLSSEESQDSLDLVLLEIGNNKRTKRSARRKKHQRTKRMMNRIDGFESYEELIGSAKRRKQFMILGGLCLLAVLIIVAIVLSVVLINRGSKDDENLEDLELDDILKSKLQPRRFNGTWIDDKSFYYFDELGDFIIYDVVAKTKKVAVNHSSPAFEKFISATSYEFSADGKYILLATEVSKLYRHSFLATWYVYNIETEAINMIDLNIDQEEKSYRLAKFGPVNAELIVVDKSNLYYKQSPDANAVQITKGSLDESSVKFNGVPDWVYEEEIFSSNSATWFSTDGKKIAFIQFDDTRVPTIALSLYGSPGLLKYPHIVPVQYPKAGAPNPTVKLFSVDLANIDSDNLPEIAKPADIEDEHLITSVAWANENDLISVWTNRVQNKGLVYKCNTVCENVLTLDIDDGWIEFYTAPFFNKDGSNMIYIGSNNGYRHVLVLDLNNKNVMNRTSGKFVVTEILKYNKDHDVIIYTANTEDDIKAQHVYAIKNENSATPHCLTCNLHSGHTYYSAEISENGNHLIITASGPEIPRVDLYSLKVEENKIELSEHIEIENNNDISSLLSGKNMPKKVYDKITFDDNTEAYVMMILPRNLDENSKYPLLVEVYGGPDSSSVTNRFSIEWGTYIAAHLGVIYIKIDGRGSGLRSDEHLHKLYKNLGTVEVEDQVRTVQKLLEKYPYLDSSRTAIWGWSYGGYVSGMSLMTDNDVFKCATSVAPVVDWMLYDSIYTERYMLTPQLNEKAYNVSRMTHFVENIPKYDKQFMLVHGTLDDNVHFQQGMVLARVLERSDIQFKEITYPDEDHSLAGVRPHLYHSLEKFFRQCFKLSE